MNLACKDCEMLEKIRKTKVDACAHMMSSLPPWKDPAQHEMVKIIYQQVGRMTDYDRESRGLVTGGDTGYFKKEWITSLKDRSYYTEEVSPEWILLTCDPNGGGDSSDTAIMSSYIHKGAMVICGMDTHATKGKEKAALLRAHIYGLRSIKRFKRSTIYFLPENNLDDACTLMIESIKDMVGVQVYYESGRPGLRTQTDTKQKYSKAADEFLAAPDRVFFDKEWVCDNPFMEKTTRRSITLKDFYHQLPQWKRYIERSSKKGNPSYRYSGKCNEAGQIIPGQKDDKVIAFIMAPACFGKIREYHIDSLKQNGL